MITKTGQKRVGILAAAVAIAAATFTGIQIASPTPASAYVCGYNEQVEEFSSDWSVNLPFFGTIDPFGGERLVGHYGNCSDTNVKITVKTANGAATKCVEPGDTRLGFTAQAPKVSGATKVGSC